MIDFEQLKINNVDLNEKIEERNDDILKLRRKVTSTVQVLTHVKEKLQYLQASHCMYSTIHTLTHAHTLTDWECWEEKQASRHGCYCGQGISAENVQCIATAACVHACVQSRDHLTRMKQSRDSLRMDNNRLRQRGGLVGHKVLLRDYQERKDQVS